MKRKVGRQALGLRRIDASSAVANDETCGRRPAVFVLNLQDEFGGGLGGEQNVHLTAEAEVLGSLSSVENQACLAFAGVAREELQDAVFEFQSREMRLERLLVEHQD